MIKIFFFILAIGFSFQIITKPGVQKLSWLLAGFLFVPNYAILIENPQVTFNKILLYTLLVVTLMDTKWQRSFKEFPYRSGFMIILLAYFIIGLSDNRVSLFYQVYRPLDFFIRDFFIAFLGWYYIRSLEDLKYIYDKLYIFFFLFCIYGFCNLITRQNEFHALLSSEFGALSDEVNFNMRSDAERFRIASFAFHPIYYGFILAIMLLLETFIVTASALTSKQRSKHYLLILLLLINLILTNSRTPLIAFVVGVIIYILFALSIKQKIAIVLSFAFLIMIGIFVSPSVGEFLDKSLNTFSDNSSKSYEQGSSVDMREMQLAASALIFAQRPITGNGFGYIVESLGFSADENKRRTDTELFGFESYTYKLLIEQGLAGIIANLILFVIIFRWLVKNRNYSDFTGRKMAYITIACLCTFLLFIFGTGDLGSFPFFMIILGINSKFIFLSKEFHVEIEKKGVYEK